MHLGHSVTFEVIVMTNTSESEMDDTDSDPDYIPGSDEEPSRHTFTTVASSFKTVHVDERSERYFIKTKTAKH
jgi:hypothetical protein